jgi:hypothetical protein
MTEDRRRSNRAGLTAGFLIIAAAVAILISYYLDIWWYFFPIMMMAGGVYLLMIAGLASRPTGPGGGSYVLYLLLWGGILAIIGAEWIVNDLYPGNFVYLFVVLLVFVGAVAIIGYVLRSRR